MREREKLLDCELQEQAPHLDVSDKEHDATHERLWSEDLTRELRGNTRYMSVKMLTKLNVIFMFILL